MGSGRRLSIEQEGQRLVESLGGRWNPGGGMCRCPAHDDRTPSLSVRTGRTRLLLHCFAGCKASAILAALEADRLLELGVAATEELPCGRADGVKNAAALRLWSEARSIAGTPASSYLAARGLTAAPTELRYHPRTPHGPRPLTQFRPALIAAVRDESGLVAVHRTFLDASIAGLLRSPIRVVVSAASGPVRSGLAAAALGSVWPKGSRRRFRQRSCADCRAGQRSAPSGLDASRCRPKYASSCCSSTMTRAVGVPGGWRARRSGMSRSFSLAAPSNPAMTGTTFSGHRCQRRRIRGERSEGRVSDGCGMAAPALIGDPT